MFMIGNFISSFVLRRCIWENDYEKMNRVGCGRNRCSLFGNLSICLEGLKSKISVRIVGLRAENKFGAFWIRNRVAVHYNAMFGGKETQLMNWLSHNCKDQSVPPS